MLAVKNDLNFMFFIIRFRGTTLNAEIVKLEHTTGIISFSVSIPYARAIMGEAATKDKVKIIPNPKDVVKAELMCDWSMSFR